MSTERWLALDGALGAFSAAARSDAGEFTDTAAGKDALERGIAIVDGVLRRARLRIEELDALAVGTGPGSFTGLRIAVSFAKGLALAIRRPLVGVSSYDALSEDAAGPPLLAVVHGRSGIACARLRTAAGEHVRCGTYDAIAEMVASRLAPGPLAVYGAVEGVDARLAERGFTVIRPPVSDSPALSVLHIAARRTADDATLRDSSPHQLRLDYGELPAAEVRRSTSA